MFWILGHLISIITLNVIQLVKIYHANCNHIPFTTLGNKLINAMKDFFLKFVSLSSFSFKSAIYTQ